MEMNEKEVPQILMYIETTLPKEALPKQMFDFVKIIENGAKKYALNNWLQPNGKNCSEKSMHDSMFHHLAESFAGSAPWNGGPSDKESGLDPLLHLVCRALMLYTRRQLGIRHEDDLSS